MSVLTERARPVDKMPLDQIYLIYGAPGTGKTVLASTFPKSPEEKMLYIDILEGGTGSISKTERENIVVLPIGSYTDFDAVLTDLLNGFTMKADGTKVNLKFGTIVIDSITQLEFTLKEYLKSDGKKDSMTLQLWGQARDDQELVYNILRMIHRKTGAYVVAICHEKAESEKNGTETELTGRLIPSLMNAASLSVSAKSSYVWYTKIETELGYDPVTKVAVEKPAFMTYIDAHPRYVTKCRKPPEMVIPQRIKDLTFPMFKENVLDKIA